MLRMRCGGGYARPKGPHYGLTTLPMAPPHLSFVGGYRSN